MALPVIVAGAARGLTTAGRGLAKGARGVGRRVSKAARKRPPIERPSSKSAKAPEEGVPGDETTRKLSAFLSPEGISMFSIAVLLDLIGIICLILDIFFGVGEIPSWISDGVGIVFISGWMWFRSGRVEIPERAKERTERGLRKLFRGKWKKFLTPILGEAAPLVGAFPFWSLAVYYELTS